MNRTILFTSIFALLFVLWSCGDNTPPKTNNSIPAKEVAAKTEVSAPNPDLGKKIFKQYCALCHGADGKLGVNGAGDLTASALPETEVVARIAKGKGLMTPFEEILSETQIKAVADYVIAMRGEK